MNVSVIYDCDLFDHDLWDWNFCDCRLFDYDLCHYDFCVSYYDLCDEGDYDLGIV
jgi:hypothetical protein